jgi:DNA polymerase (family 10)
VGPKTAALLHAALAITSLDDLEQAARAGRVRHVKGMGVRKEQLILRALEDRKRNAGRHLISKASEAADALVSYLRSTAPEAEITPVGSLRRGCETCGDLDILVTGAAPDIVDAFLAYDRAERVLARGETKASVLLAGALQADLRVVAAESRGAALQYFTGSKAHNIELRDRAIRRGMKLNEYGLHDAAGTRIAGDTEESIYQALGLAWVPPELREHRGEMAAAEAGALPHLIDLCDVRGDLHVHTRRTDGRDTIEAMARAAMAAGLEYVGIADHSQSVAMANGMDEADALDHASQVREIGRRLDGFTILAGIECDILPDGTLDLANDCLAELDFVIASVHSRLSQEESEMTDRLLRAIENPYVDILGHPTGRRLLRREPSRMNLSRIIDAAVAHGVALEINCQAERLDLADVHARLARERGARIVINTDAHARAELAALRWGVTTARRAWLTRGHVLNTRTVGDLRPLLRRNALRQGG